MSTKDLQGREFPSINSLLVANGFTYQEYTKLRQRGVSLQQMLTAGSYSVALKLGIHDSRGNIFSSWKALSEFYEIPLNVVNGRVRQGFDISQITDNPYCRTRQTIAQNSKYVADNDTMGQPGKTGKTQTTIERTKQLQKCARSHVSGAPISAQKARQILKDAKTVQTTSGGWSFVENLWNSQGKTITEN